MNNTEFTCLAQNVLQDIASQIEDQNTDIETDFIDQGLLEITLDSGVYVINTNSSVKEIWLSSPKTGPHHFSIRNNKWVNKHNQELGKLLADELNFVINIRDIDYYLSKKW